MNAPRKTFITTSQAIATANSQVFGIHAAAMTQIWNFPKLKGQENYQPWSKKMKSALKYSGLWKIVEDGMNVFPTDLPEDPVPTKVQIIAYQANVKTWKELNTQAMELIYSMCEDKPSDVIEDQTYATSRWLKLKSEYQDSGFVLRFITLQELWAINLSCSNNSIETYISNIRTKSKDLKRMGAPIDAWILVALLLNNLDGKYKDFVHRLVSSIDEVPDFERIVTMLREEEYLLKRDSNELAMAAALKNIYKEQDDKKSDRGNTNNNGGRGGRSRGRGRNTNTNTNTNDRWSSNSNNPNYKKEGEKPECHKCLSNARGKLKKHWPFDCWTLHEDRIPERYRNNNSQVE